MRKWLCLSVLGCALLVSVFLVRASGSWLVRDHPERSDIILVLAGDINDRRYWTAIQYLQRGFGQALLVDASDDEILYGRTPAQWAQDFIRLSAGPLASRVEVCSIKGDSTAQETRFAADCLRRYNPRKVLLVTSDFHTRRALSIFTRRVPQYAWSAAAAEDATQFGPQWWRHREWMKNYLKEWQKLVWWEVVDRWSLVR